MTTYLYVAFHLHRLSQFQLIALGTVNGRDAVGLAFRMIIRRLPDAQTVAAREKLADVALDDIRVLASLAQQLQQIVIAQEVEAREGVSLVLWKLIIKIKGFRWS